MRAPANITAAIRTYGLLAAHAGMSNVESAFNMLKMKFGDKLKSKNWTAQQNELLCKLICHNIVVLIHEMGGLGIQPNMKQAF